MLASDWLRVITWPGYWALIDWGWSRDLDTSIWLVMCYTGGNPRVCVQSNCPLILPRIPLIPRLLLVSGTRARSLIGWGLPSIPVIQTCHFLAWQSPLTSHTMPPLASDCQLFRKKCFIKNPLPHSPDEFASLKLNSASQMSSGKMSQFVRGGWGPHR